MQEYKGIHKFSFVHVGATHEKTGTYLQLVDQDLSDFIQQVLDAKENTILFLLSDHGSRYGKIAHSEKGAVEVKLPMLFMVGSK